MTTNLLDSTSGRGALGIFLAIGLIAGGWILGAQIKATRLSDRYVTVKGLVERKVKSDFAIWPINFKEAGDDLGTVYGHTEVDKNIVLKFLAEQGIQPNEIELGMVRVADTRANEFGGQPAPYRYIIQQQVTVQTSRVDQVVAVAQKTLQLVQKGIVLDGGLPGQASGPSYKFTGLNAIKPDMITEATRNARAAADRFASDSGSKVGSIRQANQGVFTIVAANDSSDAGEGNPGVFGGGADSSVMKTVRIVTTVQYYLDK